MRLMIIYDNLYIVSQSFNARLIHLYTVFLTKQEKKTDVKAIVWNICVRLQNTNILVEHVCRKTTLVGNHIYQD